MGLAYIKLFKDIAESFYELEDEEAGRLIKAIFHHANGDDVTVAGAEKGAYGFIRRAIDRDEADYAAACEKNRSNGTHGVRPRKNPSVFEETQKTHSVFSVFEKTLEEEKEKEEDKEKEKDVINDDTRAQDPVFGYALDNLAYLTPSAMDELSSYRTDLGDDLTRFAIDEACANGVRKWSYVRAILQEFVDKGIKTVGAARAAKESRSKQRASPQKGSPAKINPAQQYDQRDYSHKEDEFRPMSLAELTGGATG